MPDGLHMSPGSRDEGLGVGSNVDRPVRTEADKASRKFSPSGRAGWRLEHAPKLGASSILLVVGHHLFGLVDWMLVGASAWPPDAIGANGPGWGARVGKPSVRKNIDAGRGVTSTCPDAEGFLIGGLRMPAGALLAHARMLKVSSLVV